MLMSKLANAAHYNVYIGSGAGYYMDDGDSNALLVVRLVKVVELVIMPHKMILIGYQSGFNITSA